MKRLLFLFIFLITGLVCNAQFTYKAEATSTRLYSHVKEDFEEWDEWMLSDVIIRVDLDSSKIEIFSLREQKYIIIGDIYIEEVDSIKSVLFECIDLAGARCTVQVMYFTNLDIYHLYIRWKYLEAVYQMRRI